MKRLQYSGFTIVELIIVIVVVGILAAITIVGYSGVQKGARESAVTADLTNVAKKMTLDYVHNSAYEMTDTDVDGGNGLPASKGTTYQYTSTGTTYCITGTNGTVSYKITNTTPNPAPGGCPGHGVNGVAAIKNYAANPSAVGSTTGFGAAGGTQATATLSIASDQAHHGTTSLKKVITGTGQTGAMGRPPSGTLVLNTGDKVSWSFWAYSTKAGSLSVYIEGTKTADGTYAGAGGGAAVTIPANTWTKVTGTWTATLGMNVTQAGGYNLSVVAGDTAWFDEFMITKTSTPQNYADGSSTNWVWDGTANNSTSTGPPL